MVVIVAGITRSGLSLTMQMLHAGGYPCFGRPPAFEDYGSVGAVPWGECDGLAVKLPDTHLQFPPEGDYKVIRLKRDLRQQAKSFNKFCAAVGYPKAPMKRLIESFRHDNGLIDQWAFQQNQRHLTLHFESIILSPLATAELLEATVGVSLDITAMVDCVVRRSTDCYPTMLEIDLLREATP